MCVWFGLREHSADGKAGKMEGSMLTGKHRVGPVLVDPIW